MNTTENNKLIAEFMDSHFSLDMTGGSYISNFINDDEYKVHEKKYGSYYFFEDMRYHTSWDWLMPVVELINNTGRFEVIIGYGSCYITDSQDKLTLSLQHENSRYVVYNAVVEFIKWLNNQKK